MAGLANAFNSMAQFTNTAVDIGNKMIEEQARTDLLDFKSQLSEDTNNFMAKLSMSNNYANWDKELNDFVTQQGDKFQKQSKNSYTAKLAKEMMMDATSDLTNKVLFMKLGKAQEDMNVTTSNTLERNLNNNALVGQAFIDNQEEVRRNQMQRNGCSYTDYYNGVQKDALDAYNKDAASYGAQALKDLENGKSINDILIEFDNYNPEENYVAYKYPENVSREQIEAGEVQKEKVEVDFTKAKATAKQKLENNLIAKQKDIYEENNQTMATVYNKLVSDKNNGNVSNSELLDRYTAARTLLQTIGVKKLGSDNFEHWTDKLDALDKAMNSGSSSGKSTSFDSFLEGKFQSYISNIYQPGINSSYSSWYEAVDDYTAQMRDEFINHTYKENADCKSKEEKAKLYDETIKKDIAASILNSEYLMKQMKAINPSMAADIQNLATDIKKNKNAYPVGTYDYVNQLALDLFAGSNGKNTDQLESKLMNTINTIIVGKLEEKLKGNITKQTAALEDIDVVNTDINGSERWAPGAKAQIDKVMDKQAAEITKQTGIDVTFKSYEKVNNDVNNIGIFTDKDGNEYKLVSVRNEKGKLTGTKVIDANGNEVKKASETAKEKSNSNKKNTANKTAEHEEQVTQQKRDIAHNVSYETAKAAGVKIDPIAWKEMSDADKAYELENVDRHFFDKKEK